MTLPHDLESAIEIETSRLSKNTLQKAATEISNRYRSAERDSYERFMTTEAHCLAYLAVRLPATFTVVKRVLQEFQTRAPEIRIESLADIGAGPGTVAWAASEVFQELKKIWLFERDLHWNDIGKRMMKQSSHSILEQAVWQQGDLREAPVLEPYDMITLSYVVGELSLTEMKLLIEQAWKSAAKAVVVIEPGTPHGFERIRNVRELLIQAGGNLVAPCPHMNACPMKGGDWCHFAERLERDALHRSVKGVSMGYEDEKYSYVIAAKQPTQLPESRILRHPQIHSGHVTLSLCTPEGVEQRVVSKRQKALYKKSRKADWGDIWPPQEEEIHAD